MNIRQGGKRGNENQSGKNKMSFCSVLTVYQVACVALLMRNRDKERQMSCIEMNSTQENTTVTTQDIAIV